MKTPRLLLVSVHCLAAFALVARADDGFVFSSSGTGLIWQSPVKWPSVQLCLTGAGIYPVEQTVASSSQLSMSLKGPNGPVLPDGTYRWEVVGQPEMNQALAKKIAAARESGDDVAAEHILAAANAPRGVRSFGLFTVLNGKVLEGDALEPAKNGQPAKKAAQDLDQVLPLSGEVVPLAAVTVGDQIIQGSLAIGIDTVDPESFGFDTFRLKENNLQIHFDDTSAVAGFAANDWRIIINDSGSGGANFFSIEDSTAGRRPFTISAGAKANALFVDSGGKVGLGTSTPVLNLDVVTGNTPAMRLNQDASSGFTAQTWDIAGNEANFFIRDVTNGSKLPFRITPNTPTSTFRMFTDHIAINDSAGDYDTQIKGDNDPNLFYADASTDRIGMGTNVPDKSLHVKRTDGSATIKVEETLTPSAGRNLLELFNRGPSRIKLLNTSSLADAGGGGWIINGSSGTRLFLTTATPLATQFILTDTGNLTVAGAMGATAFNVTSDRDVKHRNVPVAPREVLDRVVAMPIEEWSFKADESASRHIGPMAQEFKKQFGLGDSDRTINLMDSTGVALAAIQGLHQQVKERDDQINGLRQKSEMLEKKSEALEKQLKMLIGEVEALKAGNSSKTSP